MRQRLAKLSLYQWLGIFGFFVFALGALWFGSHNYLQDIVPESTDPCAPGATRMVRDTQNSRWPVARSLEERCRKINDESQSADASDQVKDETEEISPKQSEQDDIEDLP